MKRLSFLVALIAMLSLAAFAETPVDAITVGPNAVRIEARHCQEYMTHPGWLSRHILGHHSRLTGSGAALCQADPSTVYLAIDTHNLKTNSGVDFISGQISGTASTATAQWIALSTSVTAVSAADTSLANEITTNGLGRAQGTFAHTAGTSTYTITNVFTATGNQSGIAKVGVLTAVSSGTLVYEVLLGTPISMNSGDQLSVQWTVTVS